MKYPCTGVILAGGLATRYSGKTKGFLHVGERKILDFIYDLFSELFDEILLVTNDPLRYLEYDLYMATDLFSVRSSLTGLHAGLFHASKPFAFFSASDTPFLKKELVETILKEIDKDPDVAIPETSKGLEPLCAVYSKRCLQGVERNLLKENYRIRDLLNRWRTIKISEKRLRRADPDLLSFFNINAPEDLERATELLKNN
jgi:molybdenum cofactor guanylyltransferase